MVEEQLLTQAPSVSPATVARQATSAAEIDNEMVRDKVQHLQKNIRTLEDTLERMCTANKHEDATMRERIKRYKEREDATRKNLAEGYQEVERVRMREERARNHRYQGRSFYLKPESPSSCLMPLRVPSTVLFSLSPRRGV